MTRQGRNGTTQQASSNFNVSGDGTVGGNSTVAGTSTIGGNVGIGTSTPGARLSISPGSIEAKLTLFDGGSTTAHYGLGVSGNQLNYHVLTTADRHVFYATGKNGDGTELLRIQGNGGVGIGTTPVAGARLQVGGVALVGNGGALPSATNATGLGCNSLYTANGESEFYNYRGSGAGGFRFFSVADTAAPVASNQVAHISSTGMYSSLSGRRVKTNIAPLTQGLRTVLALRPVSYDFHTSRQLQNGR
jgi:hypothetical protein